MPTGSEAPTRPRRAVGPRVQEIAERLRDGPPVRIAGAGTKLGWGRAVSGLQPLRLDGLDRLVAHERGDFTAIVEAGARLADVQSALAGSGQMLALDPPGADATVGGAIAAADCGPLRHRYGAPRDLLIGITLALADGTVAQAGGRVIKNVAGYDLAKLAAGSFGTLGVITEVCVRLHPLPSRTATAVIESDDPSVLAEQALHLAAQPLEAEAFDVRWDGDSGALLIRFAGAAAAERAKDVRRLVSAARTGSGSAPLAASDTASDGDLWAAQRARQRSAEGVVALVHGLPTDIPRVLAWAREHGASLVGRAAVGTSWLTLPPGGDVEALRTALAPRPCVITDAPEELRARLDPWHVAEGPELELMRRLKERFDPERKCNPGLFAGAI